MGGDEFIIFMEYNDSPENQVKRIFNRLNGKFKQFDISVSMGVAKVESGYVNYETLFRMADTAMYTVKRDRKQAYCFYDNSMKDLLSGKEKRVERSRT